MGIRIVEVNDPTVSDAPGAPASVSRVDALSPTTKAWLQKQGLATAARSAYSLNLDPTEPDAIAESRNIGKQLGLPTGVVQVDPKAYKVEATQRENTRLLQLAPRTQKWLENLENSGLAKDDLSNLTWFEQYGGPLARGAGRGVRRVPAMADASSGFALEQTARDVGKSMMDIYNEEVAALGPNATPEMRATAMNAAQARYETVQGLGPEDREAFAQRSAQRLSDARKVLDRVSEIPMSDAATRLGAALEASDGSFMGTVKTFVDDPIGSVAFLSETVAEVLPLLIASSAVTLGTGTPAAGIATMTAGSFLTENANSAMEFLADEGVDLSTPEAALELLNNPELIGKAQDRGVKRGLIIAMFDAMSGGIAGQKLAKSAVGDAVVQGLAQTLFGGGGEAAAQYATTGELDWREIITEALAELVTAPIEVFGVAGRSLTRDLSRAAKSGTTAEQLQEIDAKIAASKLKQRAPDKFREFLDSVGVGDQSLYVPAEDLRTFFQAKDLSFEDAALEYGFDIAEFAAMESAGKDVAIPMSVYGEKISGTDDAAWFREHGTFDQDEMSLSEAQRFNTEARETMERAFEEADRQRMADEEVRASDVQVYDGVYSQLRAAGRTKDVADHEARVLTAFFRTMAERYGDDALDLSRRFGLNVRGPQEQPIQRRRDALDIALNTIRSGKKPKPGRSLLTFVRDEGGIQDRGGDLESRDPPKGVISETYAEAQERRASPSMFGPGTAKGNSIEDMARKAAESGYFPELVGETNTEAGLSDRIVERFTEALMAELDGDPTYRPGEEGNSDLDALEAEIARLGLDMGASNDEIAAALSDPDAIFQTAPPVDSDAFRKWAGTSDPVIEADDINDTDFSKPGPYVMRAFHGTTHEFEAFDASVKGNKEGHFGAVNYFSSSEADASENYGADGQDLTNRIEQRAEQLQNKILDQFDAKGRKPVLDSLYRSTGDLTFASGRVADMDDADAAFEAAKVLAQKELKGGTEKTLSVFIRTEKPFVAGGDGSPFVEFVDYDGLDAVAVARVADDEGLTVQDIEDARDDYEDQIDEARWDIESETENPLIDAINTVAARYDADGQQIFSEIMDYIDPEGMRTADLEKLLRDSESLGYVEDPETGSLVGYQVISEIIQELGFDSIILKNADKQFKNMGLSEGTAHVHVFDDNNTNIKSVENRGTFDPSDPRIFNQSAPLPTDTPAFREWFGDSKVVGPDGEPLVVYHGTQADIEAFDPERADSEGKAFYFARNTILTNRASAKTANSYATGRSGGNVIPAYLSIKNPLILGVPEPSDAATDGDIEKWMRDIDRFNAARDSDKNEWLETQINKAKREGRDGLIIFNMKDDKVDLQSTMEADIFVAFDPTQIKSVYNRGTFDGSDPRILYQGGVPEHARILFKKASDAASALRDSGHVVEITTHPTSWGNSAYVRARKTVDGSFIERGFRLSDHDVGDRRKATDEVPTVIDSDSISADDLVSLAAISDREISDYAGEVRAKREAAIKTSSESAVIKAEEKAAKTKEDERRAALYREWIAERYPDFDSMSKTQKGKIKKLAKEALSLGALRRAMKGGSFFQEFEQTKRGSITFPGQGIGNGKTVIDLFASADLSTFLHESGHFFLEAFTSLASEADAPQAMKDDLAKIREYLGNDGGAYTTDQHEMWARGSEAYFMEGKAPSLGLADSFSRFKAWLTRIYKAVRNLGVKVTPEVREVMDRMLATDAEIKAAREAQQVNPLFTDQKAAGMSDAAWGTYQRMARRSEEQATQTLLARTMAKVRREKEKWWKSERKDVRAQVEETINSRREYRLIEALANKRRLETDKGKVETVDVPDFQIDRAELVEMFGEGVLKELSRSKFGGNRAIYGKGGVAPQEAAELFGFADAAEMIETLQNTGKRKDAIEAETDRIMLDRYGDPLNDGTIEQEALDAIHSEQQADTVASEVRHLASRAGLPTRNLTAKVFRVRARGMLGRMSVREATKPDAFLAAERKAAKRAEDAFAGVVRGRNAKDALTAAARHKEQQLLNHYLYLESRDLTKLVASKREKMRDYGKKTVREKFGEGKPLAGGPNELKALDALHQIDSILEGYDFRKRSPGQVAKTENLRDFVERMVQAGRENDLAIDARIADEANRKHYSRLSVDELRGLFDTVDNLDTIGRRWGKLIDAKRKRDLNEIASRLAGAVMSRFGEGKSGDQSGITRNFFNLLFSVDTVMVDIDGEEMGAFYDEFKAPIDEGQAREQRMNVEMAHAMDDIFSVYTSKELAAMQTQKPVAGGNGHMWSKMEIIALALNTGNPEGRDRILEKTVHPERRLTQSQLDATLDILDKRDWDFVQSVIDQTNTYWPELAAVHKRRTGTDLKKVDAVPIETKFGTYRGGYYPIAYDDQRSVRAAGDLRSAWDASMAANRKTPNVKAGMTEVRQKSSGGRTVKYDLEVPFRHMRDTIRVISMSEAIDNAGRILRHSEIQEAFMDAGQTDMRGTLDLFLGDLAVGPVYNTDPINAASRAIKNNFTMAKLGFNFKTVALQLTGVAQSAAVIGKANMLRGYRDYFANSERSIAMVMEKSDFMAERKTSFQKDIYDQLNDVKISTPIAKRTDKAKQTLAKAGFWTMQKVQFLGVDVPTWIGAYDAELRKSGDDAKAVRFADRMVARSQGSGLYADRNAVERGTISYNTRQADFIRLWTTLGSYMVLKMNRTYLAVQAGRKGISEAENLAQATGAVLNMASNLALLHVAEGVVMGLGYAWLAEDEDDDELIGYAMEQTALSVIGGVPIISGVANAFQGYGGGGVLASVIESPAKIYQQVAQGENDKALWRAFADGVGITTGLPSTAAFRAFETVLSDDDVPLSNALFGRNPLDD